MLSVCPTVVVVHINPSIHEPTNLSLSLFTPTNELIHPPLYLFTHPSIYPQRVSVTRRTSSHQLITVLVHTNQLINPPTPLSLNPPLCLPTESVRNETYVIQELDRIVRLFRYAANRGDALGQVGLGFVHYTGEKRRRKRRRRRRKTGGGGRGRGRGRGGGGGPLVVTWPHLLWSCNLLPLVLTPICNQYLLTPIYYPYLFITPI